MIETTFQCDRNKSFLPPKGQLREKKYTNGVKLSISVQVTFSILFRILWNTYLKHPKQIELFCNDMDSGQGYSAQKRTISSGIRKE